MRGIIRNILSSIQWYHFLILPLALCVILISRVLLQMIRHRRLHRVIWPVFEGAEIQRSLDEAEAVRHIERAAAEHHVSRRHHRPAIRAVHWSVYLRLQLIRRRLSRASPEIISMIPASLWLFENF